jgi:hypothetical protein
MHLQIEAIVRQIFVIAEELDRGSLAEIELAKIQAIGSDF